MAEPLPWRRSPWEGAADSWMGAHPCLAPHVAGTVVRSHTHHTDGLCELCLHQLRATGYKATLFPGTNLHSSVQKSFLLWLLSFLELGEEQMTREKLVVSPWDSRALLVLLPKADLTQISFSREEKPAVKSKPRFLPQ